MAEAESEQMGNRKILIIDDDNLVRRTVEIALKSQGMDVSSAESVDQGVALIRQSSYDLIISDIRMPQKNGVTGIREIRAILDEAGVRDVPIIFITGFAEMGEEYDAEQLGEVILKPFDLSHLLTTVREYL